MSASYGRSRSGNRFYSPPAVRRQLQLQQQQLLLEKQNRENQEKLEQDKQVPHPPPQQQLQAPPQHQQKNERRIQKTRSAGLEQRTESDDCASSTSTTSAPPAVPSSSTSAQAPPSVPADPSPASVSPSINLDRFLEHTTPLVPAQYFPRTSTRRWKNQEGEVQTYFVLGDLWDSFKEWSAYGAGVPLLLNGSDSVIQYYVPYLSGIQLYIDPSMPPPRTRRLGEESDAESSRGSSDGSCDFDVERGQNHVLQDLGEAGGRAIQSLPLRNSANNKLLNGSSSDEGDSGSSGVLKFEYLEHEPPHSREPLTDKISVLSTRFPELKTCRSCDLSPASWVSVAWYPIYRIPTGPTLQNLDSCFLTFHSLCTPIDGRQNEWRNPHDSRPREIRNSYGVASVKLPLPTFGLAPYKFKASFWDRSGAEKSPKANTLMGEADKFLRHLNVSHPDYNFFFTHFR